MSSKHKTLRVIWAVDPSNPRKNVLTSAANFLKTTSRQLALQVEPVSVLNPFDVRLRASITPKEGEKFRRVMQERVQSGLKISGMKGLAKLKILVSPTYSFQSVVRTFLRYADRREADLIVVSSVSKGAFDRWILGSFAEAVTLKSKIPVVVVHPRTRVAEAPGTILFPTDFSAESRAALDRLSDSLIKSPRIHVVLFHQFEVPLPYSPEPFTTLPISAIAVEDELNRLKNLGEKWVARLRARGVSAEFVMNREGAIASNSILKLAKKRRPWMVALSGQKGPWASAFLGSTSKQVLRAAHAPVWILHR